MFEKWRKPGQNIQEGRFKKIFSYIVFGLICLVFVFLAPMSPQLFGGGAVAYVGSEAINSRDFNMLRAGLRSQYESALNTADSETAQRLESQISKNALQQLVTASLISQMAKKTGFTVSDQELQDEIRSYPYFQRDGQFSYPIYLSVLKAQRISSLKFEERVYKDKITANWRNLFFAAAKSNTLEKEKFAEQKSYKMNIRIAQISLDKISPKDLDHMESLISKNQKTKLRQYLQKKQVDWKTINGASPINKFDFVRTDYENNILAEAIISHLPKTGLVPRIIKASNKAYAIEILSFRTKQARAESGESSRFLDYQKSLQIFETWVSGGQSKFPIKQNIQF